VSRQGKRVLELFKDPNVRLWTIIMDLREVDKSSTQEVALLTLQEQHERLGHVGYACIKAMEDSKWPIMRGLGKTRELKCEEEDCRNCEICRTTKSHATPNREARVDEGSSRPGKILHLDTLEYGAISKGGS